MLANRFRLPIAGRFEQEMNQLLHSFLDGTPLAAAPARVFPAVNVWEDGDHLFAEAEVPGLSMNDLEIFVVGSELTIKGRRGAAAENVPFHRRERGVGEFARAITLPLPVNAEKVEAKLADGILTITLPKAEEAKPRKIQIKTS